MKFLLAIPLAFLQLVSRLCYLTMSKEKLHMTCWFPKLLPIQKHATDEDLFVCSLNLILNDFGMLDISTMIFFGD